MRISVKIASITVIPIIQDAMNVRQKVRNKMDNCWYCKNADICQYIVSPNDCEDFEETFEHHWEMMDDIEREEYFKAESEEHEHMTVDELVELFTESEVEE